MKYFIATQYPSGKWEVCVRTNVRQSQMMSLPSFPAEWLADIVTLAKLGGWVRLVMEGVHRVVFTTENDGELVGFGWGDW